MEEILKDKFGKIIEEGHFLRVNPDDDDWIDLVVSHHGKLRFSSEISHKKFRDSGTVPLRDVLEGSENPAIIVGHITKNRIEFYDW